MKFCKKRKLEYTGINKTTTSVHYVTEEDIALFHGNEFVSQWKILAQQLTKNKFGADEGYYYTDYQQFARATNSYINAV